MKSTIAILSLVAAAVASPDPQITERAQLGKRQSDPALLGYVSTSGASSCKSSPPPTPQCLSVFKALYYRCLDGLDTNTVKS